MSHHPFRPDFRSILRNPQLGDFPLEASADVIYLASSHDPWPCLRMGLRGVPMNTLDFVVDGRLLIDGAYDVDPTSRDVLTISSGVQTGKINGKERDRVTLRIVDRESASRLPWSNPDNRQPAAVLGGAEPGRIDLKIVVLGRKGQDEQCVWARSLQVRHERLEPEDGAARVLMYHIRYFLHLPEEVLEEARLLANATQLWCHLPMVPKRLARRGELAEWAKPLFCSGEEDCGCAERMTLASANRAAERALYRLSCDAGYRRLTLRERSHLGLDRDSSIWHTKDSLLPRYAAMGGPMPQWARTGAGEHTFRASRGNDIEVFRRSYMDDDECVEA